MDLGEYTTLELLKELIRREDAMPAPMRRDFAETASEFLYAIGPDHTAYLTIFNDALEELRKED